MSSSKKALTVKSMQVNALHFVGFVIVVAAILTVGFLAVRSHLFALQRIDIQPLSNDYPVRTEEIESQLQLPRGKTHLVDLDLKPIEARLMKNPWVKGVVLSKQFPDRLIVQIIERKPVALVQSGSLEGQNRIFYLEEDGSLFDEKHIRYTRDLPILTGFSPQDPVALGEVSGFIAYWFDSERFPGLKLSSVSLDPKLGLRAVVAYPMKNQRWMRAVLELGLNIEEANAVPHERLKRVLDYLASKSTAASRIWLGDGKKIVVKMSRGS
jgi:hypothetical protein